MRRLSLLACAVLSYPAVAGGLYMEAFDLQRCEHWQIQDSGYPSPGRRSFPEAKKGEIYWVKIGALALGRPGDTWHLTDCSFQFATSGEHENHVLRSCETAPASPLSGASYEPLSKHDLFNYKCKAGCSGALRFIYTVGEGASKEYTRAYKRFKQKCERNEAK